MTRRSGGLSWGKCQPACKPGFVQADRSALYDHSSGTPVAGRFTQPTRVAGPETALETFWAPAQPLFGLAPGGVCPDRFRCRKRGALLPHHFTLAPGEPGTRFVFCGTVPGVAPAGRYPAPCFHGARTFLPRTLSGLAAAVIQPAGRAGGRGGGLGSQCKRFIRPQSVSRAIVLPEVATVHFRLKTKSLKLASPPSSQLLVWPEPSVQAPVVLVQLAALGSSLR